ncbi:galactose-1-phosphate uridylyltransferase [Geothrix limicola]|uniref:Galactose-1-phosphate uridylyltransferase n=1 Tax=Geothrix limicola TaxID=2927978 RepID=A0ABQ5QAF7_9BACT|nr:UDP-glucose--hexose-1-phosphate uridylyltransferase [Geothrix limicola]GLH71697.1 galactose-1-phosphate uridylyltransferase [Geothrix limicola]
MFSRSHRRLNLLTGEHVLVSPQRTQRPWQGKVEARPSDTRPAYDPACYLCAGNARAGGHRNPDYVSTFVFTNDFAALSPHGASAEAHSENELLVADSESGTCRVVCFSPRHDLSLPEFSVSEIDAVLRTWTEETRSLGADPGIRSVLVFENKGELMGCSNPHPHSQIWANEHLPTEMVKELGRQEAYFAKHGRPLLMDYLAQEREKGDRIVLENDAWVALVPFWAMWPYETLVLPKRPVRTLLDLDDAMRLALADLLKRLTTRYDNLFGVSFPYSMGFHQAPFDDGDHPEWVLHLHFYPPLLRGATVKKFMVGYEMLGMPGRDITPETAAAALRELPDLHYKQWQPQG